MFVRKKEMTRLIYGSKPVVVTLLKVLPQSVSRVKTLSKDWYLALVIGVNPDTKVAKSWKSLPVYDFQWEFSISSADDVEVGSVIDMSLLEWVTAVSVSGVSKGKWFQWYIKRYHAKWMPATHGHKYTRHWWSIGNRKPRRTQKWHPNPGHMWSETITLHDRSVLDTLNVNGEQIIVIKWSVPGPYNGNLRLSFG